MGRVSLKVVKGSVKNIHSDMKSISILNPLLFFISTSSNTSTDTKEEA